MRHPELIPPLSMSRFLAAALYRFVALPDCDRMREPLLAVCLENQVKGTLLLAPEGINGTIAGLPTGVSAVLAWLRTDPRLADLAATQSWSEAAPFLRMKVRVKQEIVTMHVADIDPTRMAGQYVRPQDWNALISEPDVVVVDARNDYEVAVGTFVGALDPKTRNFSELPGWIQEQSIPGRALVAPNGKRRRVAMFCTGGIRCEKSTAYLRQQGFEQVYHLQGGILKYLESVPPRQSLWQGECFVFDERVSVGHGLGQGRFELCRACRMPVGAVDKASPKYLNGVSCPRCFDSRTETQKRGFAERQRQVELASSRDQRHVGAAMPLRHRTEG